MMRKLRFGAAALSILLAMGWMAPLALSENGEAAAVPTQGIAAEGAAADVSGPEPEPGAEEKRENPGGNAAPSAEGPANEAGGSAPTKGSDSESGPVASPRSPAVEATEAPGQRPSTGGEASGKTGLANETQSPSSSGGISSEGGPTANPGAPADETTEAPGQPPATTGEPTGESTEEPTGEPTEEPAEEITGEAGLSDDPAPAASLAEEAAFTSGYAVVLPDSALVYSQWKDTAERTALLKLHGGEVVYVDGLAEHTQDGQAALWASIRVQDAKEAEVEGFVPADALRALDAEAASMISGIPGVSGERIQPKAESTPAPSAEPEPTQAALSPEDLLAGASIRTAMYFDGDVIAEGAQVTLAAEVSGMPEGLMYTLHWQNDLDGEYRDVPGGTGASFMVTATRENMACNWRVLLTADTRAPEGSLPDAREMLTNN